MDVTSIHVHGETDTESGDTVQKEAPRRNVEERCRDLTPRCEPRPIEVGEPEASARGPGDPRDDRQCELGPREVRRVDDEPVGETQQVPEGPRAKRRRPGPPEEHRKV